MRALAALIVTALLSACGEIRPMPPPKVVEVVVEKIVPVPAALTADCQAHEPRASTVEEAVRLANARKAALEECTGRMRKIRGLAP